MAGQQPLHEFLSLPPRDYPSDDDTNSIQPALDTLYHRFAQRNRSESPTTISSPRSVLDRNRTNIDPTPKSYIDLRSLDYVSDHDSHLICPICHVPFVEPVVLDCDHTFCSSCFDEYTQGLASTDKSRCPSCRTLMLSNPKKASRLISNMCNDIKVQCPNEGCLTIVVRGCIERHVLRECLEQPLECPDNKCNKRTKRKNFVPQQCIHDSHIECECGLVIELGRGEWLKHKDEDCPKTTVACDKCGERIPAHDYRVTTKAHKCNPEKSKPSCPGAEFGCQDDFEPDDHEKHTTSCPMARLAPHLSRQNRLINALSDQVAQTKIRNEVLESGLEHIDELLRSQVQPQLNRIQLFQQDHDHDIEEIERDHIPSAAAVHHRDLLLPAHIRDLTPSPTMSYAHMHQTLPATPSYNHLLALHESLYHHVNSLENDMTHLQHNMTELDARTSMALMNETLRLKEELAHVNAALFSTRAQVQWLLNRERMNMGMMRGRPPVLSPQQSQSQIHTRSQTQISTAAEQPSSVAEASQSAHAMDASAGYPFTTGLSGQSSTSTSPTFGTINMDSTRRPSIRRPSGGSQERFKL